MTIVWAYRANGPPRTAEVSLVPTPHRSPRTTRPRPAPPRRRRRRKQDERPRWGMRMATGLSVLVLGAGGIGHAVVTNLESGIDRIDPFKDMKNRPAGGAA